MYRPLPDHIRQSLIAWSDPHKSWLLVAEFRSDIPAAEAGEREARRGEARVPDYAPAYMKARWAEEARRQAERIDRGKRMLAELLGEYAALDKFLTENFLRHWSEFPPLPLSAPAPEEAVQLAAEMRRIAGQVLAENDPSAVGSAAKKESGWSDWLPKIYWQAVFSRGATQTRNKLIELIEDGLAEGGRGSSWDRDDYRVKLAALVGAESMLLEEQSGDYKVKARSKAKTRGSRKKKRGS